MNYSRQKNIVKSGVICQTNNYDCKVRLIATDLEFVFRFAAFSYYYSLPVNIRELFPYTDYSPFSKDFILLLVEENSHTLQFKNIERNVK